MPGEDHVRVNRRLWNEDADDYQRRNAPQIRDQAFTGLVAALAGRVHLAAAQALTRPALLRAR
jgi:hypothetical protein